MITQNKDDNPNRASKNVIVSYVYCDDGEFRCAGGVRQTSNEIRSTLLHVIIQESEQLWVQKACPPHYIFYSVPLQSVCIIFAQTML